MAPGLTANEPASAAGCTGKASPGRASPYAKKADTASAARSETSAGSAFPSTCAGQRDAASHAASRELYPAETRR